MSGEGPSVPDALDTVTCLRLGEALYRFLARLNDESECDVFSWEDRGVSIDAGFIEFGYDTVERVQLLIDKDSHPSPELTPTRPLAPARTPATSPADACVARPILPLPLRVVPHDVG